MTFYFTRERLTGTEQRWERLFELLPGGISWTVLLGMLFLACWQPFTAALLIIAFDFYWLLRLLYLTVFLVVSYVRLSMERQTDWLARVRGVECLHGCAQETQRPLGMGRPIGQRISHGIYRRQVEALLRSGALPPHSEEIRHVVIIPIAKEAPEIYEPGIQSLAQQRFPSQQILVVLAVEGRAAEPIQAAARAIHQRYRHHFLDLLLIIHPDGLPGEARVKGANVTYAAKGVATHLRDRGIPFHHVVVSCFDADTVVSPNYFACLTYHFMVCPDRIRASFQPIPVYHNNIWEVPGFARVLDVGASFFQLVEATNPEKLVTFSSHSMSFQALVEVGYWPVDMISDDSAIFWKAFIHYDGRYRVVPMYVTVSMDVAASDSWQKTVVNVYRQKRRWAWGVENLPIVLRAFLRAREIPLGKRLRHAWKLLDGHVAWATWPVLLGIIGWLPAWFAGREFSTSVVYYSAPRVTVTIFRLASVGLALTILLSLSLLPTPSVKRPWLKQIAHLFEWGFVPIIAILLSAIPALDAQTRLMLGKDLEFWVTDKTR